MMTNSVRALKSSPLPEGGHHEVGDLWQSQPRDEMRDTFAPAACAAGDCVLPNWRAKVKHSLGDGGRRRRDHKESGVNDWHQICSQRVKWMMSRLRTDDEHANELHSSALELGASATPRSRASSLSRSVASFKLASDRRLLSGISRTSGFSFVAFSA